MMFMEEDFEYKDEIFENLWTKLHAPICIKDMALSKEVREQVNYYLEKQDIPTLLFCGKPGQGKTTLAMLLCKEINATYIKINASRDNGINVIRNRVTQFAETMSVDGSLKVIILDEADRLSAESQDALRGIIEDYAEHTRFILTANEASRITEALKSRCIALNIIPPFDEFKKYIVNILKKRSVNVDEESVKQLASALKKYYPDLRKTIGLVQKWSITGRLLISEQTSEVTIEFIKSIFNGIEKANPIKIREYWIKNENDFQGDYPSLLIDLHKYVYACEDFEPIEKAKIIMEIAEGLRNSAIVFDQEINFYDVILRIMKQLGKF